MKVTTFPYSYRLIASQTQPNLYIILEKQIGTCALGLVTKKSLSLSAPWNSLQKKLQRLPGKPSLPIVEGKTFREFPGSLKNASKQSWTGRGPKRKYFRNPTPFNFTSFKKAKAKCKFTIEQAKSSSWKHYVSKIIKKNTILILDAREQANYLACRIICKKLPFKLF